MKRPTSRLCLRVVTLESWLKLVVGKDGGLLVSATSREMHLAWASTYSQWKVNNAVISYIHIQNLKISPFCYAVVEILSYLWCRWERQIHSKPSERRCCRESRSEERGPADLDGWCHGLWTHTLCHQQNGKHGLAFDTCKKYPVKFMVKNGRCGWQNIVTMLQILLDGIVLPVCCTA